MQAGLHDAAGGLTELSNLCACAGAGVRKSFVLRFQQPAAYAVRITVLTKLAPRVEQHDDQRPVRDGCTHQ
jgi:hypothetical protein